MELSGVLYADFSRTYDATYVPDIVFAHRPTRDLKLQLLVPEVRDREGNCSGARYPLVVVAPGSGWHGSDSYRMLPILTELTRHGYAVASVEYRGTERDDVRFPAAVQDVNEAIRFLRKNAEQYLLDPERVALFGDSSGGNTVAMCALTAGEERFNIGENLDQPTEVKAVVVFYGPVDLPNLVSDRLAEHKTLRPGEGEVPFEAHEIYKEDYRKDPEGMLTDASPLYRIRPDKRLPPFVFFQGEEDPIIPMAQGDRFCRKLREAGGRAEFYKIAGALHGTGCWTRKTLDLVCEFLAMLL